MKILKKISLGVVLILVAMQFYSPTKNISPGDHTVIFTKETNPSQSLKNTLKNSCFDCHSDNTAYPWYNNIAPISYWIADHVQEGKEHLNFSKWEHYTLDKKNHLLQEIEEVVGNEEMPLTSYTYLHREAALTEIEKNEILDWVKRTRVIYQLGKLPK
ncbi:heme-binding domain-containing protein [Maribacter confluentis]|uniref:Haem-binding domain-containing protein n=2 Tax=Maribacter TaxID=252356 RepID=A0ABY1SFW2_9FLAO|nr:MULTISPECIES: heme-binding domain-containing protein [Maribacter]MDO1511319.1 heme-binding domain-containing protein [Maribacter confluentis]TVZ14523.1 heme-binding protein [Maribacter sp. MAR_2009_72]SNR43385.1 Haem-binding domain-containing protein [Maribacter sedimenticola]